MPVHSFVPYAHVQDVNRSIAFYALLGLECDSRFGDEGDPFWARMISPGCDLMLAKACGPVDAGVQAVLFYLHTQDLAAVRAALLAGGVADGGAYQGEFPGQFPASGILFDNTHPHWMPAGEMRVHDPDGYVLLIGQED